MISFCFMQAWSIVKIYSSSAVSNTYLSPLLDLEHCVKVLRITFLDLQYSALEFLTQPFWKLVSNHFLILNVSVIIL